MPLPFSVDWNLYTLRTWACGCEDCDAAQIPETVLLSAEQAKAFVMEYTLAILIIDGHKVPSDYPERVYSGVSDDGIRFGFYMRK